MSEQDKLKAIKDEVLERLKEAVKSNEAGHALSWLALWRDLQ